MSNSIIGLDSLLKKLDKLGGNVEEVLSFNKLSGEDLEISFNPDYMKDALQGFGQTAIEVDFTAPLRPFTLVPTEDKERFIQLITPVRTF